MVEDDHAFAALVLEVLRSEGLRPLHCPTLAAAHAVVEKQQFDLVLLDNHLPDGKGYDFFDFLSRRYPEAPILMITGAPDLGEAVQLTRNGLFDYLTKPVTAEALLACIGRAKKRLSTAGSSSEMGEFYGISAAAKDVRMQLQQAAKHPSSTVLLTGETGSGKDVAAKALHAMTHPQGGAPFVAVNCATLPAEMFESELFGAERGAYTGAEKKRAGLVAAARGGTLFLDEIGEVPLGLQAKLLRFLENREFRPLGSTEDQSFTGRCVAATNRSLAEEVRAGRFREDLLYRLDVLTIALPPLRQRKDDLPGLAQLLLSQLCKKYDRGGIQLKPEDQRVLSAHDFPGNVRELRNILERSLLKTPEESRWLKLDQNWSSRGLNPSPLPTPAPSPVAPLTPIPGPLTSSPPPPPAREGLSALEAQEYRMIQQTLRETQGGIRRTAAKLGLSPQALIRRLEKWPELRESGAEK